MLFPALVGQQFACWHLLRALAMNLEMIQDQIRVRYPGIATVLCVLIGEINLVDLVVLFSPHLFLNSVWPLYRVFFQADSKPNGVNDWTIKALSSLY